MLNKKQIEGICEDTIRAHRSSFESLKKRWNSLIARYENKLREESISAETESKVALGGAFALVENALPRIFARDPKYKYLGRESKDMEDAEEYNSFSNYQWEEAKARKHIKKIARWALATGLAGWKMGWKKEIFISKKRGKEIFGIKITNPIVVQSLDKLKLGKSVVADEKTSISNYTLQAIPPHKLIWSVESEEFEDCRVFGHTERRRVSELKGEGYDVSGLITEIKQTDKFKEDIAKLDNISIYTENKLAMEAYTDVAELYTRILNDEGVYEYHVVVMAVTDNDVIKTISFSPTPFNQPFVPMGIFRPIDRLGKMYGFGLIEPSTGILDSEEDTLNMSMEALWVSINPPVEYNPGNMLSIDTLEYRARTLNPVRALGQSMSVMPTPQLPMTSLPFFMGFLQKAKQNTSGITDYQSGAEQAGGDKTAFEVRSKTMESNQRMRFIIDNFDEQVILPIGRYALYLNQQYLADEPNIFYRVVGRKGTVSEKKIKFKTIEAIKDISIIPGSTMMLDSQEEIAKWERLIGTSQNEAKMGPGAVPINRELMFEKLMEDGYNIKDAENYIPSIKEREEKQVTGDVAQIDDAKSENANPVTARVLPEDNPSVHIPLHQAEIKARQQELQAMGSEDPQKIEELQLLIEHLNLHTQKAGGAIPPTTQNIGVEQNVNPNQQMQ